MTNYPNTQVFKEIRKPNAAVHCHAARPGGAATDLMLGIWVYGYFVIAPIYCSRLKGVLVVV